MSKFGGGVGAGRGGGLLVDKEVEGKTEDASMRKLLQRTLMVDVQAE